MSQDNWQKNSEKTEYKLGALSYLFYTLNITLLPGIGFLVQLLLWRKAHKQFDKKAEKYIKQSILASIMSGLLLVLVSLAFLAIGGLQSPWTWMLLIIYFTLCHSCLILLGVLGFSRFNAGKPFSFFHASSWWDH